MEANSGIGAPVTEPRLLTLNILSPSTEIPNRITLKDCTASTTVAELKVKISRAIPSQPAPERQRLIYRGRPLLQENATLKDIFTQEAVSYTILFMSYTDGIVDQRQSRILITPCSTALYRPPILPNALYNRSSQRSWISFT